MPHLKIEYNTALKNNPKECRWLLKRLKVGNSKRKNLHPSKLCWKYKWYVAADYLDDNKSYYKYKYKKIAKQAKQEIKENKYYLTLYKYEIVLDCIPDEVAKIIVARHDSVKQHTYAKKTIRIKNSRIIKYCNEYGYLHNKYGPAIEFSDGSKNWYINGKLHRVDGPAILRSDGYKAWYKNDKLHREDGPAIKWPKYNFKAWYKNGKLHREDGPAVEDGNYKEWYLNDRKYNIVYDDLIVKISDPNYIPSKIEMIVLTYFINNVNEVIN